MKDVPTMKSEEELAFGRCQEEEKELKHEGCTNQAKKGGVCIRHGAKKKKKTCSHEGLLA